MMSLELLAPAIRERGGRNPRSCGAAAAAHTPAPGAGRTVPTASAAAATPHGGEDGGGGGRRRGEGGGGGDEAGAEWGL